MRCRDTIKDTGLRSEHGCQHKIWTQHPHNIHSLAISLFTIHSLLTLVNSAPDPKKQKKSNLGESHTLISPESSNRDSAWPVCTTSFSPRYTILFARSTTITLHPKIERPSTGCGKPSLKPLFHSKKLHPAERSCLILVTRGDSYPMNFWKLPRAAILRKISKKGRVGRPGRQNRRRGQLINCSSLEIPWGYLMLSCSNG